MNIKLDLNKEEQNLLRKALAALDCKNDSNQKLQLKIIDALWDSLNQNQEPKNAHRENLNEIIGAVMDRHNAVNKKSLHLIDPKDEIIFLNDLLNKLSVYETYF